MKKTAISLMITGIISKIFGFGRYITLASFYGASNISDAYLIALTIPMTIFQFIGQGISTTLIPIYSRILAEEKEDKAQGYINNLINILFALSILVTIMSIIFAPWFVKLFASGFKGETLKLTINLTRITLVGICFSALMSVLTGYLHVYKSYIIPSLVGLPLNIIIIISIVISKNQGVYVLAFGTALAMFTQFIMVAFAAYKKGYRHHFIINMKEHNLKKMLSLSVPTIVSTSVKDINQLVDRTLASRVAIGGISALSYASRLNQFIQQVFVMSLVTVMYPLISIMSAENDIKGLKKSLSEIINVIILIVVPITFGATIFAKPIVNLLFGRGAFDIQAVIMTSDALVFYSFGMVALGLREVLSRVFFSLEDTKTPMVNASIGMGLNIILNLILVRFLGVGGLALATSIATILTTVLMFKSLRKKIGSIKMKRILNSFIKVIISSILMGLLAKISFNFLASILKQNIALLLSITLGAVSYFIVIYFMKIEDFDIMVGAIKRKIDKSFKND